MRISFFSCSLESFFRPASAIFLHTEQRQRRRQDGASSSSHEPDDIWNANSSNCEIELNTTSYDGAWQSLFSFWMNRISLASQSSDEGFRNVLNTAIHAHTHTDSVDLSFHCDGRTVNDLAICFGNYFLNAYRQLVFPLLPFRFVARLGNRLRAHRAMPIVCRQRTTPATTASAKSVSSWNGFLFGWNINNWITSERVCNAMIATKDFHKL